MRSFSFMIRTTVLFLGLSTLPALAQGNAEPGPWAWLALDADLAEQILYEGDRSAAGQLALDTHNALTAAADHVTIVRGEAWVATLHQELSQVLEASGFQIPPAPNQDGLAEISPR